MNKPKITDFQGELRTENGHHIWHSAESQYFEALEKYAEHLEKAYDIALKGYDNQIDVLRCDKCELYHEDCVNESCVEHYKKMIDDYLSEKELENGK